MGVGIADAVAAGIKFLYGCLYLTVASIYAVQQEEFWSAPSDEQEADIAKSKSFDAISK